MSNFQTCEGELQNATPPVVTACAAGTKRSARAPEASAQTVFGLVGSLARGLCGGRLRIPWGDSILDAFQTTTFRGTVLGDDARARFRSNCFRPDGTPFYSGTVQAHTNAESVFTRAFASMILPSLERDASGAMFLVVAPHSPVESVVLPSLLWPDRVWDGCVRVPSICGGGSSCEFQYYRPAPSDVILLMMHAAKSRTLMAEGCPGGITVLLEEGSTPDASRVDEDPDENGDDPNDRGYVRSLEAICVAEDRRTGNSFDYRLSF